MRLILILLTLLYALWLFQPDPQPYRLNANHEIPMSINFSPFATNVLDMIDVPMQDALGRNVLVKRAGIGFCIYINGAPCYQISDNLVASRILNELECTLYPEQTRGLPAEPK